ncbi:MAG: hypothetical protein LAN37_10835 [Acidobacteriia bacterium]|nr:hypothetical protein [Terriglobia bacterium]
MILVILNILAFIYPAGVLLGSEDDASRLFAIVVLMGGFIFVAVADAVSIVLAYWV